MTRQHESGLKPPAAPVLLEPREEAVLDGRAVTFTWEPAEGATAYRLEVAADTAFDQVVFEQAVGGETTLMVKEAFPTNEATFYWRVIAQNAAGESLGDAIESFISSTPEDVAQHFLPPDQKEHLGPLPEAIVEGARKAYRRWEAVAGEPAEVESAAVEVEEEPGVQHEGVGASGIMGFVFAAILVLAVAVTVVFFLTRVVVQETRSQTAAGLDYPDLREVEAKAAGQLGQYGVVNAAEQVYRIPIDRAMELMINEAYRQPVGGYSPELRLQPRN